MSPGDRPRGDLLTRLRLTAPERLDDPWAAELLAERLWAVSRLLLVVAAVVGALGVDDLHPSFWAVAAVLLAVQTLALRAASAGRAPPGARATAISAAVDLALTAGILLTSGGGASPLRVALVTVPLLAGYLREPRAVLATGGLILATYLGVAAPELLAADDGAFGRAAAMVVALGYATAVGVTFGVARRMLHTRAVDVDTARRHLLTAGLETEGRERRRLSQDLHAGPLQDLLAARQDLAEDDPEADRRAREALRGAVAQLRRMLVDLHPSALRQAGVETAVRHALEHRSTPVARVRVLPDTTEAEELLLVHVARELGDALASAGVTHPVELLVQDRPPARLVRLLVGADAEQERLLREATGQMADVRVGRRRQDGRFSITARLTPDAPEEAHDRGPADLRRRAGLLFAAIRVAAVPVAGALALIGGEPGGTYALLLGLTAALAIAQLVVAASAVWEPYARTLAYGLGPGLAAYAASLPAQGGVTTPLTMLALTLPLLLVLRFRPRVAGAMCAGLGVTIGVAVAPEVLDGDPRAREAAVVLAAAYAWATTTGLLVLAARRRVGRGIAALEQQRYELLERALTAADAERRRLASRLHDGAVQELLVAGQDLDEALAGDAEAHASARRVLASGIADLREVVDDLHPPALGHGGLQPALRAVVERAFQRRPVASTVHVDPTAEGVDDELVLALVRELATNAAKHARARQLAIRVERADPWVTVRVADDGVGIAPERLHTAVTEGHIGLASVRERVEADGGRFAVACPPGAGTTVEALLPVARGRPDGPDPGARLP